MGSTPVERIEGFGVSSAPHELVLGTFDRRLTIFDQQVRALNLAFRLKEAGVIPQPGLSVAVIGAGIAGLTFAAGCVWLGQRVVLVEKQPVPCHLQRGCDIRWVHPHIYHWPRAGSEQPYAGLPLLSWMEGTASEVARQIVAQWEQLAVIAMKLGLLEEVYSAHHRFLPGGKSKLEVSGVRRGEPFSHTFDAIRIVYAVGFGVEEGQGSLRAHSYWENDSFNQLLPGHPPGKSISWLVSGMGDGGLIDLQRLCIESFRQGRVVAELFEKQKALVAELRQVAATCSATGVPLKDPLDAMASLGKFDAVDAELAKRRRKDTAVWLNGKSTGFGEALNQSRASFLNRFILHRLHKNRAFEYIGGELWEVAGHRANGQECYRAMIVDVASHRAQHWEFDQVVRRYGTRKSVWLEQAGFDCCEELQTHVEAIKRPLRAEWQPGWWSLHADRPLLEERRGEEGGDKKAAADQREYVTPVTEAIATTFVRTVAGSLLKHGKPDKKFRLTLHRVVPINGRLRVQQIAEYAGTRHDDTPTLPVPAVTEIEGSAMQLGAVGRVFDVNHLTIGLCVRRRLPCLLRSAILAPKKATDLRRDMDKLFLDDSHARHMVSSVRSILTVPFLAAAVKLADGPCVNLVLYADSDENDFFTPGVLNELHRACASFREHLDTIAIHTNGNHRLVEWDWGGIDPHSIKPAESSVKKLKTLVRESTAYGALLKPDMSFNAEALQFRHIDAIDVVPNSL